MRVLSVSCLIAHFAFSTASADVVDMDKELTMVIRAEEGTSTTTKLSAPVSNNLRATKNQNGAHRNLNACDINNMIQKRLNEIPTPAYYLQDGNAPNDVDCALSLTDTCPIEEYDQFGVLQSSSRDSCYQCDFDFSNDKLCYDVTCTGSECLVGDNVFNATVPDTIEVCIDRSRVDSFSYSSTTTGGYYTTGSYTTTCSYQTAKKEYKVDFTSGVTNIRSTTFTLGDASGRDLTPGKMDLCTFEVDGKKCNSCRLCDAGDIGFYELDCSNIKDGATTSCDSFTDRLFINPFTGNFPILLTLQEGYTHSPTVAPTAAPTVPSPTFAPYRYTGYGNNDDDDGDGLGFGAILAIVAFVASWVAGAIKCCSKSSPNTNPPPPQQQKNTQAAPAPAAMTLPPLDAPKMAITVTKASKDQSLGISFKCHDESGAFLVSKIEPAGPFAATALKIGMRVWSVNGVAITGRSSADVVFILKGNQEVTLLVQERAAPAAQGPQGTQNRTTYSA